LPRVPGREGEPARVGDPGLDLAPPGGDVARFGGMMTAPQADTAAPLGSGKRAWRGKLHV
jgi:hypothetical protein